MTNESFMYVAISMCTREACGTLVAECYQNYKIFYIFCLLSYPLPVYTQWQVLWSGLILQTMYPVQFLVILSNLHVTPAHHHPNREWVSPSVETPTQGVTRSQTSLLLRILYRISYMLDILVYPLSMANMQWLSEWKVWIIEYSARL